VAVSPSTGTGRRLRGSYSCIQCTLLHFWAWLLSGNILSRTGNIFAWRDFDFFDRMCLLRRTSLSYLFSLQVSHINYISKGCGLVRLRATRMTRLLPCVFGAVHICCSRFIHELSLVGACSRVMIRVVRFFTDYLFCWILLKFTEVVVTNMSCGLNTDFLSNSKQVTNSWIVNEILQSLLFLQAGTCGILSFIAW